MSDDDVTKRVDIVEWVEQARADPQRYMERQATEVLLAAVGQCPDYGEKLYLKGGVLMGVVYHSPRQTADIDFTADFPPDDAIEDRLRASLDPALQRAAARQGYPYLVCRVQKIKRQPRKDHFTKADFPALLMTIGYAERDTPGHNRLDNGQSPHTLSMDISFREPIHAIEFVHLSPDSSAAVHTYSLTDVIAEKLRALLQQPERRRNRRQDVYDIDYLVGHVPLDESSKKEILDALYTKARQRGLEPDVNSMSVPDVRAYAEQEWQSLAIEVDQLPPFGETFERVVAFYRSLPWATSTPPQ